VNQQRVVAASDFFNEIDPELPFKVGPLNEREARESGHWLEAWVAGIAEQATEAGLCRL
jgi:hypothetical protein